MPRCQKVRHRAFWVNTLYYYFKNKKTIQEVGLADSPAYGMLAGNKTSSHCDPPSRGLVAVDHREPRGTQSHSHHLARCLATEAMTARDLDSFIHQSTECTRFGCWAGVLI